MILFLFLRRRKTRRFNESFSFSSRFQNIFVFRFFSTNSQSATKSNKNKILLLLFLEFVFAFLFFSTSFFFCTKTDKNLCEKKSSKFETGKLVRILFERTFSRKICSVWEFWWNRKTAKRKLVRCFFQGSSGLSNRANRFDEKNSLETPGEKNVWTRKKRGNVFRRFSRSRCLWTSEKFFGPFFRQRLRKSWFRRARFSFCSTFRPFFFSFLGSVWTEKAENLCRLRFQILERRSASKKTIWVFWWRKIRRNKKNFTLRQIL